ncbi:carbon-nitrogen hydrolase family protein [Streptomyces clavuligerus]|nr:carbon-nitrogen hydrolase family protein [Streptomyces clavuligerus]ANW21517.1 nitrilase [Streptomyces clavuligerus]AXU16148.1 carbon-nitrogen hydrolase family protein [Streptomyces clavuligerus]MBY6306293.1 carbon-nitrogen hydrolase family protein [Streptomyces clavuligerus]QCS08927.1 nitrilase [Streptomyces clavuligerus]QPJ91738.1 nitrilase [Streptomyces clavuligerus]
MRIALSQLTTGPDPARNLAAVRERTRRAADAGARLVVFPEATMASFGTRLAPLAEPLDGPWAEEVRRIAAEASVTVVAGMFTPAADGKVTNTLLATGPGVEAAYDKIHLFDAFGFTESATVAAGSKVVTVLVDGVRVGLATCYDVRFPELFRAHADAGCALTVLPASWGAGPGKREQWELLVRARALDATLWVAAVGQADPAASGLPVPPKAPTGIGHSALVAPDGTVRARLDEAPGLLIAEVDPAEVESVRRQIPVLANRRL